MKRHQLATLFGLIALLLLLGICAAASAQISATVDLNWHVFGSGGGNAASASYQVSGTIGQPIAAGPVASSARFRVSSGYWVAKSERRIYLPTILRDQ